jgi:hypothetical protein
MSLSPGSPAALFLYGNLGSQILSGKYSKLNAIFTDIAIATRYADGR